MVDPFVINSASGSHWFLKTEKPISWYTCGPTVYDLSHIGHARVYMTFDSFRKCMESLFHMTFVTAMNVTDVDEKIIAKTKDRSETLLQGQPVSHSDVGQLSQGYLDMFENDMARLDVSDPDIQLRVTEHISCILHYIQVLLDKGAAYIEQGSVRFSSGWAKIQGYEYKFRTAPCDSDSEAPQTDFYLWKARESDDFGWDSPWGKGIPGWHVECSALASKVFGSHVEIHAGGCDLQFPHHSCEAAQSEAYWGVKDWISCYMHVGHLNISGLKMSKSLKNFISIEEFLTSHSADSLRMTFLLHHYAKPIDFQFADVDAADKHLTAIVSVLEYASASTERTDLERDDMGLLELLATSKQKVLMQLSRDFHTREALFEIINLCSKTHVYVKASPNLFVLNKVQCFIRWIMTSLGFFIKEGSSSSPKDMQIVSKVVLPTRQALRRHGKQTGSSIFFELSDFMRQELSELGFLCEDGEANKAVVKTKTHKP